MGRYLQAWEQQLQERIRAASDLLRQQAANVSLLREKLEGSKTPWATAGPIEPMDMRYPLPAPLPAYTVAATDGSQIEPDRHGTVLCHLINVGWAVIRYGDSPTATISSRPFLYYEDHDTYFESREGRRVLVAGQFLDMKRNVEEIDRLATLAEQTARNIPLVAMADGQLVLRAMEGWRPPELESLLERFRDTLTRFQSLQVPPLGYVSRPRYADVVGTLRVAMCPYDKAVCAKRCGAQNRQAAPDDAKPCGYLAGLVDRMLMERLPLQPGERSARFRTLGGPPGAPTHFFYIHTGQEIGRVEVPDWVANRPDLMDLVHWIVYDQCQRGNGYPRVLTEAHERAVLSTGDRRQFEQMVDGVLARHRLSERTSAKERTKRVRGL